MRNGNLSTGWAVASAVMLSLTGTFIGVFCALLGSGAIK